MRRKARRLSAGHAERQKGAAVRSVRQLRARRQGSTTTTSAKRAPSARQQASRPRTSSSRTCGPATRLSAWRFLTSECSYFELRSPYPAEIPTHSLRMQMGWPLDVEDMSEWVGHDRQDKKPSAEHDENTASPSFHHGCGLSHLLDSSLLRSCN